MDRSAGWLKAAFGLLVGLLAGGLIVLLTSRSRGQPVMLLPPPTPAPLVVHVSGAVANPGMYTLPSGSRVQDAIQAAGGAFGNLDHLNLAAYLQDGARLNVPELPGRMQANEVLQTTEKPATPTRAHFPVNINQAGQAELESLPYIGPALALRIIAYRQSHGPFKEIADIQNVRGIGPSTFEQIKDLITTQP